MVPWVCPSCDKVNYGLSGEESQCIQCGLVVYLMNENAVELDDFQEIYCSDPSYSFDSLHVSGVYLLHFHSPISDGHTTQHYIGYASDIAARMIVHHCRPDARLLQVAKERGIDFEVARIWEGAGRDFERKLKDNKYGPKICPICNPGNSRAIFS